MWRAAVDWGHADARRGRRGRLALDGVHPFSNGDRQVGTGGGFGGGWLKARAWRKAVQEGKIAKVAYIGTPHLGAPKAIKALLYGDDMGFGFGSLHILSPARREAISQNMPSVYDLLPSAAYGAPANASLSAQYLSSGNGATVLGQNEYVTRQFMTSQSANPELFDQAESLHQDTDAQAPAATSVYDFVGCGDGATIGKTIAGIVVRQRSDFSMLGSVFRKDYQVLYTNGDGTVPLFSAESSSGARYYVRNVPHAELPSAPGVPDALLSLFSDKPVTDAGAVSTSQPSCDMPGTVISVHGPVALDVYDGNGDHSGMLSNGYTEQKAPGVSFDTIGDASFAFIPKGDAYTVLISPSPSRPGATYDAYVQKTAADDTVTSQAYFNALQIPDGSTITRVDYGIDAGDQPSIAAGIGKDGIPTSTIYPSATSVGSQAADITPPLTTAIMNDDGTIALSASDDAAGVLRTDYSTDGISWQEYAAPFVSPETGTVFFSSTDAAGNVEDEKEFTVPASEDASPPPATSTPDQSVTIAPVPAETLADPADSTEAKPMASAPYAHFSSPVPTGPVGLLVPDASAFAVSDPPPPLEREVRPDPAYRSEKAPVSPTFSEPVTFAVARGTIAPEQNGGSKGLAAVALSNSQTAAAINGMSLGDWKWWIALVLVCVLAFVIRRY